MNWWKQSSDDGYAVVVRRQRWLATILGCDVALRDNNNDHEKIYHTLLHHFLQIELPTYNRMDL